MTAPVTHRDESPLENGYRIEELVGRQRGIGKVHVATHLESERQLKFPPWPVALKLFTPRQGEEEAFRRRFEEVAHRQRELHDPNVASVYQVGTAPMPFISMTLFRGPNLADVIAARELDDASVLAVIESVASALEAGRAHDLVYRRLRPSSVLVGGDGERAFLGDFGAGRSPDSTALMGGEQLGTFVDYISPEEVQGAEVSTTSNVYSLAAIAFECLTGEPPFPRREGPQALSARLEQDPRPLGMLRPDLPGGLESVLRKALSAEPSHRFRSPGELVKEMRRAYPKKARKRRESSAAAEVAGMPAVAATPPPSVEKRRIRRRGAATRERAQRERNQTRVPASVDGANAAQATEEAPATRSRRLAPAILLLALLLAGAAVLGAVAAPSGDTSSVATPAKALTSGALGLRYPGNWTRANEVPNVPGLELSDPVAVTAPAAAAQRGGTLVAGHIQPDGDEPLPSALLERLPGKPEREAVDLGAVQAYRYTGLRPRGFGREANLYVVPTSGQPVVLGCLAPPASTAFMAQCERVASTVALRGESPVALAPSPRYARGLQRLIGRLNRVRRDQRDRLARARTRRVQADASAGLAVGYRTARRAAERVTPPPGAHRVHAEIVRGLARAEAGYRQMAAAARARSGGRWRSGAATARSGEDAVQKGVEGLRALGYDPY